MHYQWNKFFVWFSRLLVTLLLVYVVVAVAAFSVSCPASELKIRYCGLVLQATGLFLAFVQIKELKKIHGVKSNYRKLVDYIKACPLFEVNKTYGECVIGGITVSGEASIEVKYSEDSAIEDRVYRLEMQMSHICELINVNHKDLTRRCDNMEEVMLNESSNRKKSIEGVQEKMVESAVGGIFLTELSLLYIFIGSVMSSVPDRIYTWFK